MLKALYQKTYQIIDEKGYIISEHETRALAIAARRVYLEGVEAQPDRDAAKIKEYYKEVK